MSVHLNLGQDPIKVSLLSIVVSFCISIIFLSAVKPKFVVTPETQKLSQKKVETKLLLIYSALFAIFIGIVTLLWRTSQKPRINYATNMGGFKQQFGQSLSPISPSYKTPYSYGTKQYSMGGSCMKKAYNYGKGGGCGCT